MEKVYVQVKDNSPSIERILRPITYTSWLLGVGVAHPRKCPKAITIIIGVIYMAVYSYTLVYHPLILSFVHKRGNLRNELKIVVYMSDLMFVLVNTSIFYNIYHGIRQYNKWPELMDRLKELDEKIRKEISMNDRSIKIVEALAIFITFIFSSLWLIFHILHLLGSVNIISVNSVNDLLFYFILAQSLINSFVFDIVVYVLYRRFLTLNKLIEQLDQLSDVQWIAFKIRRIRELHADICDLASMVNDIHGFYLLFCAGDCFSKAVFSLLFFLFNIRDDEWLYEIQNFLVFANSMQFYLICWICTLACEESNRTGRIIHKITLNCNPAIITSSSHNPYVVENFLRRNLDLECVTKEVNNFSIQLQHYRVAFTASNFFEVHNFSYSWFVGMVVTYVIIFLQAFRSLEKY